MTRLSVHEAAAPSIEANPNQARFYWMMFALALFIALLFNGTRHLWDTSETRYAEAAREMARSGNWLVPMLEGQPHLTKPPLTYWLLALMVKVGGLHAWAMRFFPALAYAICTVLTGLIARELTGNARLARLATWLALVSPLPLLGSHAVTTDSILTALEFTYVYFFVRGLRSTSRRWLWAALAWVFAGLAFLTKGPPALLLALACLVYLAVARAPRRQWGVFLRPDVLLIFFAVALSWVGAVLLRVPGAMNVWRTEMLHKVLVESTRDMPAVAYLGILLIGALPGSLILLKPAYSQLRRKGWWGRLKAEPVALFCVIWVLVPLVIFMASKTRLPLYVLPLIAPINILAAMRISRSSELTAAAPRKIIWPSAAIVFVFLAAKLFIGLTTDDSKDMYPVAQAIKRDVAVRGQAPFVAIDMAVMGNGLLFYLDGPRHERLRHNEESAGAELKADVDELRAEAKKDKVSASERMAAVLARPMTADEAAYIVFQSDDVEKLQPRFADYVTPVFTNTRWAVWRQKKQLPVDFTWDKTTPAKP